MTTSLCYVASPTNGAQIWMTRIADWDGRAFQLFRAPGVQRPAVRTRDTADRIPIYQDSSFLPLADREIGVWDWEIDERGKITVRAYRDDIVPIQVLSSFVGQNLSPVQIASKLKSSPFSVPMHSGKLAIMTSKDDGFLIDRGMTDHFMPGFQLNKHCMRAPHFTTTSKSLRVDFLAADKTPVCFNMLEEPPHLDGTTVLLDEQTEVIRQFFVENLTKKTLETASVTRTERQRFMDILSKIDLHSMAAALAEYLGCDEDTAKQEIDAFKERVDSVDILDDNDDLLNKIFETNPEFKQKCLAAGEARWKQSNEAIVAHEKEKVDKRIDEEDSRLKLKLEENQTAIDELDCKLKTKQDELSKLEEDCEEQDKRKKELEATIPETQTAVAGKLKELRDNLPAAFAEFTLLRHIFGLSEKPETTCETGFCCASPGEGEIVALENVEAAVRLLRENLRAVGLSGTKTEIASVWLTACAIYRTPLFLVGQTAESFAAAIAASFFGVHPAVLDCSTPNVLATENALLSAKPPVCIVRSPFAPDWIGRLSGLCERSSGKTMFLCVTPFHEDLSLEPRSLYSSFLPFFTDVFTDGFDEKIGSFRFGNSSIIESGRIRQVTEESPGIIGVTRLGLSPAALSRLALIDTTTTRFQKQFLPYTGRKIMREYGVILPIAVATGQTESVRELFGEDDSGPWKLRRFLP